MNFTGMMAQVGFDAVQWTSIGIAAFLLLCNLAACALAFSAAGAARRARDEMKVLEMESRALLGESRAALDAFREQRAQREVLTPDEPEPAVSEEEPERDLAAESAALENAKTAATVPAALLGRAFRRRS